MLQDVRVNETNVRPHALRRSLKDDAYASALLPFWRLAANLPDSYFGPTLDPEGEADEEEEEDDFSTDLELDIVGSRDDEVDDFVPTSTPETTTLPMPQLSSSLISWVSSLGLLDDPLVMEVDDPNPDPSSEQHGETALSTASPVVRESSEAMQEETWVVEELSEWTQTSPPVGTPAMELAATAELSVATTSPPATMKAVPAPKPRVVSTRAPSFIQPPQNVASPPQPLQPPLLQQVISRPPTPLLTFLVQLIRSVEAMKLNWIQAYQTYVAIRTKQHLRHAHRKPLSNFVV
eukprot:Blabericola_migrator_1__697@NODE_1173_length_5217_cov_11_188544_g797_i0_p3_GENE_NODE_1173_length_5217_cov_11_188544_g797_i0NODE_1173_length_5217_cov_11_188544_g797_i0_p3_ORF_typecomplete_len292_score51_98BASP1/PF05466_12/2_4_NODE_1173_length_5217_cov_11_188544_g797_i014932368